MKTYIGVKQIQAEPCSQDQFAGAKNKGDLSKLAGGVDQDGYRVIYEDGYVSWSPKEVFEKAYREIGDLSVGAIAQRIPPIKSNNPTKVRMIRELGELVARVEKLKDFLKSETYQTLDAEIQNLLTLQHKAMMFYLSVLIERFEKM